MPRGRSGWSPPRPDPGRPAAPHLHCTPARRGRKRLWICSTQHSVSVGQPAGHCRACLQASPLLPPPIIADHVIRITRLARLASPGSSSSPALHKSHRWTAWRHCQCAVQHAGNGNASSLPPPPPPAQRHQQTVAATVLDHAMQMQLFSALTSGIARNPPRFQSLITGVVADLRPCRVQEQPPYFARAGSVNGSAGGRADGRDFTTVCLLHCMDGIAVCLSHGFMPGIIFRPLGCCHASQTKSLLLLFCPRSLATS